ncbi:MAG: transposase InsO family protein [Maribacter sp.]|jgi:transposase InsO family protein
MYNMNGSIGLNILPATNYLNLQFNTWYNTERLHSGLGYLSSLEMERKLRGLIKNMA